MVGRERARVMVPPKGARRRRGSCLKRISVRVRTLRCRYVGSGFCLELSSGRVGAGWIAFLEEIPVGANAPNVRNGLPSARVSVGERSIVLLARQQRKDFFQVGPTRWILSEPAGQYHGIGHMARPDVVRSEGDPCAVGLPNFLGHLSQQPGEVPGPTPDTLNRVEAVTNTDG